MLSLALSALFALTPQEKTELLRPVITYEMCGGYIAHEDHFRFWKLFNTLDNESKGWILGVMAGTDDNTGHASLSYCQKAWPKAREHIVSVTMGEIVN